MGSTFRGSFLAIAVLLLLVTGPSAHPLDALSAEEIATAVAALREAGANCHVTNLVVGELDTFAHKNNPSVHVTSGIDLADEAAVTRFYASLPPLWGSIHIAGGFAMAPAPRPPSLVCRN